MTPREVLDVDNCSITVEEPDAEFKTQRQDGAVVQISASCWLGNRKQLDKLIAELVAYANELDNQKGVA